MPFGFSCATNLYIDVYIIYHSCTLSLPRSIIPRSLSSTFQTGSPMISSMSSDSVVDLSFRPSLRTDLMCHQSEKQKERRTVGAGAGEVEPYDLTTIFFHKIGSCFNQLQSPITAVHCSSSGLDRSECPAFREAAVRKIFQMVQTKFLSRDLLEFLDSLTNDIYVTKSVKVFPYKSISETLTLVLISLLRELVHSHTELAAILVNDIQGYIKQVFQAGSEKILSSKTVLETSDSDPSCLNVSKLNLLTNAVCVDILVWAAREESGADHVLHKLTEQMMFARNKTARHIQAHLPVTLVCLEGLGSLAEKHPILASTAISCLRYI